MKKLIVALGLFTAMNIMAQSTETAPGDTIPWELRKQSFIYNTARLFNDPIVSRMALYNLIAENPLNGSLYDSIAYSYFEYNQFVSAALASQRALDINPEDELALDISANSFERLGVKDKALTFYEKLYLLNNDLNLLYKISFIQMELERFAEANASVEQIITNEKSKEIEITFQKISNENEIQSVTLDICALRVKAMIEESKGNLEGAKAIFIDVLTKFPGFEVVQKQIQELGK